MSDDIEHEFTDGIVCPFCGYGIDCDLHEYGNSGKEKCEGCGNEYTYEADYDVTYSTHCVVHEYGETRQFVQGDAAFCIRCGKCKISESTRG